MKKRVEVPSATQVPARMVALTRPFSGIAGSFAVRSRSNPFRLALSLVFQPVAAQLRRRFSWVAISARFHSSKASSGANGSVENPSPAGGVEHQHGLPTLPRRRGGASVFVTLPVDAVGSTGQMSRRKTMAASFVALKAAGVEGVAVEVWWGIVERDVPGVYNWAGYVDLVSLARRHGLKVRTIMAFHHSGSGPGDPCWASLPQWVVEEIDLDPDLVYSDRFGRRSKEYISLGCDILPVLKGRTPIQAYSDFMRNFRDTFREFLGSTITEVQVGMGPAGELRYPSRANGVPELGGFQCYDKYMLASLNACAKNVGKNALGIGGPLHAGILFQNSEETNSLECGDSWDTTYIHFFLEWYSEMLLLHGERLCMAADAIFWGTGVKIFAKTAGIHRHYRTNSHPTELTAGYYNTLIRDYLPVAGMLGRFRMSLCCTCFDMGDVEQINPESSPEGFLKQLIYAARMFNLPLAGEISVTRLNDASLKQIVKSSMLYTDGLHGHSLSFNFVRMNKNLFDSHNWTHLTRFVRQMSDARTFRARHDFGASDLCFSSRTAMDKVGRAFACF